MFDLTSSKLLILALVALVVVGPKDLPVLLRALGKYLGIVRRQANEFRAYFDEAMKEQELATLKAEMDAMRRDVQATVASAGRAIENDVAAVTSDVERSIGDPKIGEPSNMYPGYAERQAMQAAAAAAQAEALGTANAEAVEAAASAPSNGQPGPVTNASGSERSAPETPQKIGA